MEAMRTTTRIGTLAAVGLLIGGCATPIDSGGGVQFDPEPPPTAIAADGEVLGQGTVLQIDGEPVDFCLGAVAESYPPQCSGPEIVNWDWASVDGEEAASGVTWGAYAVQGTWDGVQFTITQPPILLALYDPMADADPHRDPANAGSTSEARLEEIQAELPDGQVSFLFSGADNGYLFVGVIYDDGRIQAYFDELYGADVIVVESALRPVSG